MDSDTARELVKEGHDYLMKRDVVIGNEYLTAIIISTGVSLEHYRELHESFQTIQFPSSTNEQRKDARATVKRIIRDHAAPGLKKDQQAMMLA